MVQNRKPVSMIPAFLLILISLTCTPALVFVQGPFGLPPRHMIQGVPQIHQGKNECGPASIGMVLNYWGINKGKEELKEPLRWDSKGGVAPINMIRFAHESGFKFESPEEGSIEGLMNYIVQGRPVIVRQWLSHEAKRKGDIELPKLKDVKDEWR